MKTNPNNYDNQRLRGVKRKLEAIEKLGGMCKMCGYNKNLAALDFHHIDPTQKEFRLDIRRFANNNLSDLSKEIDKCMLLCANCHREIHNPQLVITDLSFTKNNSKRSFSSKQYGRKCLVCDSYFPKMKGKVYCSATCKRNYKNYPNKEQIVLKYSELESWERVAQFFNISRRVIQRLRQNS